MKAFLLAVAVLAGGMVGSGAEQIKQGRYLIVAGEIKGVEGKLDDVKTMFKIDTETNRTWVLTFDAEKLAYVWVEVKESKR